MFFEFIVENSIKYGSKIHNVYNSHEIASLLNVTVQKLEIFHPDSLSPTEKPLFFASKNSLE